MPKTITLPVPGQIRRHVLKNLAPKTKGEQDLLDASREGAAELEAKGMNSLNTIDLHLTNDAVGSAIDIARVWLSSDNGNNVMAAKSMLKFELEYEPDDPREIRHEIKMPKSLAVHFAPAYGQQPWDKGMSQVIQTDMSRMRWTTTGGQGRVRAETLGALLEQIAPWGDSHPRPAAARASKKFAAEYTEPYEATMRLINGHADIGHEDQAADAAPWKPDLPKGVSIRLTSDRPETYGVFCSRHEGAEILISEHEDMGYAVAGANAHGSEHPEITVIPEKGLEVLKGFAFSEAQISLLSVVSERGSHDLIEDPNGFYVSDGWGRGKPVNRTRVLDLWARGWLMYSPRDGRRYFRLTPSGTAHFKQWQAARDQGLIDYAAKDSLNSAKEQREAYPRLVAEAPVQATDDETPDFMEAVHGRGEAAVEAEQKRLVVVACGEKKSGKPGKIRADERYIGNYFTACLMASEVMDGATMVLSAKYGLIPLSEEIENYDVTLGSKGSIRLAAVKRQVEEMGLTDARVTVLGGARYVKAARQIWTGVEAPLTGGIGQQLKQLAGIYQGEALTPDDAPEDDLPERFYQTKLQEVGYLPTRHKPKPRQLWFGGKAGRFNPEPGEWVRAEVTYTGEGRYTIYRLGTSEELLSCTLRSLIHWGPLNEQTSEPTQSPDESREAEAAPAPVEPAAKPAVGPRFYEVPENWLELAEEGNTKAAQRYWTRRCEEWRLTGK
ncbi:DUF6884 domain-containing protein [Streptomyces parvus]|uniref:DUF6884 domain-containing protein n=1 Tax=Streptomyces parvus TaxID=66428 RepID=A0A7K3S122_9ACTN|nr:DUF6884 domain-containing protein [Streptomyces parvus]NEC21187.1 hypothetical protein [Streptomyces parvus]